MCEDSVATHSQGLVFLGSGLELGRAQGIHQARLLGALFSAAEETFPGNQEGKNQKELYSRTHLDGRLSKPLLPRDLDPKVLPLSPAGRSEQVWAMEMLLQQEKKTDS